MCGRFTLETPVAEIAEIFGVEEGRELELPARYNISPTQPIAVVRGTGEGGVRELALVRWGLLPGWVEDPADWPTLINARSETLGRKPAFEDAFRFRRCLVPADGFYEWRRERGGKQPYYVRAEDGRPLAFAGLWERWVGPDDAVESCAIVTTDANELLAPLHDRMPVILDAQAQDLWLDPQARSPEALAALLGPFPSTRLAVHPVSRAVNRAEADGPQCIEPLELPPPEEPTEEPAEEPGDRPAERRSGAGRDPSGAGEDERSERAEPSSQLDLF